jgi:hypothetical protein
MPEYLLPLQQQVHHQSIEHNIQQTGLLMSTSSNSHRVTEFFSVHWVLALMNVIGCGEEVMQSENKVTQHSVLNKTARTEPII